MKAKKWNFWDNFSSVVYMYKLIWKVNKKFILYFPITILLSAISPFPNLLISRQIINEIANQRRYDHLLFLVLLLLGFNLMLRLIQSIYSHFDQARTEQIKHHLNLLLQEKMMKMDYSYLERPDVLDSRAKAYEILYPTNAGHMAFRVMIYTFNDMIANIITIVGLAYILSSVSWLLLVGMFAVVLINCLLGFYVKNKEFEAWTTSFVSLGRKLGYLQNISTDNAYAKELRVYSTSDWIGNKMKHGIKEGIKFLEKSIFRYTKVSAITGCISAFLEGSVYFYVSNLFFANKINIGDFSMLIASIINMADSLNNIARHIVTINNSGMYIKEFIKFIEIENAYEEEIMLLDSGNDELHDITFKDVWFKYPGQDEFVLKNINIKINGMEKLAIVGDNGAGKSTFIKLVLRLYKPDKGQILLNGKDIYDYSFKEYINKFSAVFQDFFILAFSIMENIVYDNEDTDTEKIQDILKDIQLEEKIESLPNKLNTILSKLFDEYGLELSGGEQQKIAISSAIYRNSPMIILDEPTAMLSPAMEYNIYSNFHKMVSNKSAIYISHRMSSCKFCDNIAVFDKGTIIEYGKHDELIKLNGLYTEMFEKQSQYYTI